MRSMFLGQNVFYHISQHCMLPDPQMASLELLCTAKYYIVLLRILEYFVCKKSQAYLTEIVIHKCCTYRPRLDFRISANLAPTKMKLYLNQSHFHPV